MMVPHSPEAERSFLGSVLIRPEVLDEVQISSDDFYDPRHRRIYDAARALREKKSPLDAVLIAQEAWGSLSESGYLFDLAAACPHALNASHYAQIIADTAILRKTLHVTNEIRHQIENGEPPDKVIPSAQAAFNELAVSRTGATDPTHFRDAAAEAVNEIEDRLAGKRQGGIRTGTSSLDMVTGGFGEQDLVVVAGRPGMGKTALVGTWVVNAASNKIPCLGWFLEMRQVAIVWRLLSQYSGIEGDRMHHGFLAPKDRSRLQSAAARMGTLPIWMSASVRSLDKIIAGSRKWRALKAPAGPAIIVVDYLQLISHSASKSVEESIAGAIYALNDLASELKCTVIATSQLNREIEKVDPRRPDAKRAPKLSDLRGSGSIEQAAALIMFIEQEFNPSNPQDVNPAMLHLLKNRHGRTATIAVNYHSRFTKFVDPKDTKPTFSPSNDNNDLFEREEDEDEQSNDSWNSGGG